jgi:hypothetical protein
LLNTAPEQRTATFEGQVILAVAAITNQNTETIAQLSNLLSQNSYTGLRLAAAKALRNMHTPKENFFFMAKSFRPLKGLVLPKY